MNRMDKLAVKAFKNSGKMLPYAKAIMKSRFTYDYAGNELTRKTADLAISMSYGAEVMKVANTINGVIIGVVGTIVIQEGFKYLVKKSLEEESKDDVEDVDFREA